MRRLIAVLLALQIAAPAAANTLIVRYYRSTPNPEDAEQQYSLLTGLLNRRGANYSVIPLAATKTQWMRTGLHVWKGWNLASASTEQFDCVVILGFEVGQQTFTGSRPESLTVTPAWPTVPVVFIGNTVANAGKWTASSTCSTGVKSLGVAYSSVRQTYSASMVGSTAPWKSMVVNLHPVVPVASPTGITFRPIVKMGYTSATPGGIPTASSLLRTDPDSGYVTAGSDSVVLWATYAPTITNAKPIIFCDAGCGVAQDVGLMAMAMQMADSASGGRVWDKAGAKPIKLGFAVTAATSRGKYTIDVSGNTEASVNGNGAFCYADSCDTTNVLAGLDSLGTLTGLKTTFYVDACSLATYPSVKNWFSRAGNYHVGIQPIAGAVAGASARSSSTHPADPFGRKRTRLSALPWGGVSPAADTLGDCSAASDTILTYCGIVWQRALVNTYFPGLLDDSVYPALGDWSPLAYTKLGGGPGIDSVAFSIWKAGIRSLVIWPVPINSNPSVTAAASVAGGALAASTGPTDPYGYFPDARPVDIFAVPGTPGRLLGRLKLIAERGQRTGPNVAYTDPSHDIRTEWFGGAVSDRWYQAPIRYYYHSFFVHTPLLTVSLGQLGGHGVSPGAVGVGPARIGWWTIKHTANEVAGANSLGWVNTNGKQRTVFEWVFVEDLDP